MNVEPKIEEPVIEPGEPKEPLKTEIEAERDGLKELVKELNVKNEELTKALNETKTLNAKLLAKVDLGGQNANVNPDVLMNQLFNKYEKQK